MSQTNPQNESALATRTPEEIEQLERLDALIKGSGGGASTNSVRAAAAFMKWAQDGNAHMISPATAPPNIPVGFEFAFSRVLISGDTTKGEVYKTEGGKLAIHKSGLEKLAKAAGVVWDMKQCGRTDDMKDSNFAAYRAVGHYRDLDGTIMPVFGEKQMDLREGSERAKSMTPGDLKQQRKFIAEHAETKAKLRAIRSLGIKSGYTERDFDIPFVVVKLAFNGRTSIQDDPDRSIQKAYSLMIAQDTLGVKNLLYGAEPGPALKDVTPTETATATEGGGEPPAEAKETATSGDAPKQCAPGKCLLMEPGAVHISECYGVVREPEPWVIPSDRGPASGLSINDERITPAVLEMMRSRYVSAIESESTPPLERQGLVEEQKFLEAEIKRRQLFEHAPKS